MSKVLDNGIVLTLGLVGVVAAAGAFRTRGSSNKHEDLKMVRDRLNEAGFNFVEDEEYTKEMSGDSDSEDYRRFADEHHKMSIRLVYDKGGDLVLVQRKYKHKGVPVYSRELGTFKPSNIRGILSVIKRNASKRKR